MNFNLTQNESLADYNTWRVGGVAEQLYKPASLAELQQFLQLMPDGTQYTWLGLGSNVLVRDGGIPGVTILTQYGLSELQQTETTIKAQAGVTCAKLAKFIAKSGLVGGEFFAGIPGTVGGAAVMNAGAFGGETWCSLMSVDTINRQGEIRRRSKDEFQVGYRQVDGFEQNEWVVAADFQFLTSDEPISELQQHIKKLLKQRNITQPIGQPSCGSVFRNPEGDHAARLIEASGLKGHKMGHAWISDKHANFIVHDGKATATDIERLIRLAQDTVAQKFGIMLQPEVKLLGKTLDE